MEAIEIPYHQLERSTLMRVIEEYVCREGTDYGEITLTLDDKVGQVVRQLKEGRAILTFDPELNSCSIQQVLS